MNKRKKLLALLGAMVLTVGTVGAALAIELKDVHQGITVGWDENGDPFVDGGDGDDMLEEDCGGTLEPGDIVFHFVQSGPGVVVNGTDPYGADDLLLNLIDVEFTGADDQNDVPADSIQNSGNVDWYVWVSSDGGDVTLDTANSNVVGNDDTLRVSHICVGDEPGGETEPPATDEPTDEPDPTPTPEFSDEFGGDTDEPSEPNTATIGGNGTSGPADGAWLLVVALGVLLASVVVMTPARAKSRR